MLGTQNFKINKLQTIRYFTYFTDTNCFQIVKASGL